MARFSLLLAFVLLAMCVEKSKFRQCLQTAFCARSRALTDRTPDDRVHPDRNFVALSPPRVDSPEKLRTQLQQLRTTTMKETPPLFADFEVFDDDILRLTIFETNPLRYNGPREEVLIASAIPRPLIKDRVSVNGIQAFTVGNLRVAIQERPFRVLVFENTEAKTMLFDINRQGLLNFEHMRARADDTDVPAEIPKTDAVKPAEWDDETDGEWSPPNMPNPAFAGRWEEKFGTHDDVKKYGPTSIGIDVWFSSAKHVYGIPSHASSFSLKPTRNTPTPSDPYRLYNLDVFEYELHNPMALYGSVPFLLAHGSDRTVGMLWLNAAETWVDIWQQSDANDTITSHWFSESGQLEMYLLPGPTARDVMRQYASLTGTTPLPPKFALGYHQCKWNYKSMREVAEVESGFDANDMPVDVIWLDIEHTDGKRYFTWDKTHFNEPIKMLDNIASHSRRMVTIVDPHIKRDPNYAVHAAAERDGVYVRDAQGKPFDGSCWPGASSWVDYTDRRARKWWSDRFMYDAYQGSTRNLFIWNDMNEPSVFSGPEVTMPKNCLHAGQREHRDVHNIYGMLTHQSTWEGLLQRDEQARANHALDSVAAVERQRPFVLTRSFFAGSQRYGAVWTGDNKADWSHLAISIPMLLAHSVAGIAFVGADVGGFFGNPSPLLITRWTQAAAFQPFFRNHAHLDSRRREPYLFEEPFKSAMRAALRERYALLPYWYTLFRECAMTGMPPMRPMMFEFARDASMLSEEAQYMLGSALLVRPVTNEFAKHEFVVLPATKDVWFDRRRGRRYNGGDRVSYDVSDVKRGIPLLQRGGTIVPEKWRARRAVDSMLGDPFTLVIALDAAGNAVGELYADDEHTFAYERGAFVHRRFEWRRENDGRATLRSIAINVMSSATPLTADQVAASSWARASIERLVVHGLAAADIGGVTLRHGALVQRLEYRDTEPRPARLTIDHPNVPISQDFEIEIALAK